MGFFDTMIEVVSPSWALSRAQARAALDVTRRYEAASVTKRTKGWNPGLADASTEAGDASPMMRSRVRDAVRNNSYAKKGVEVIRNNVVGRGIRLSVDGKNKKAIDFVESSWKRWAGTRQCDALNRKNFYSIQRLVINTVFVDGEVLVVRDRGANRGDEVPFKLQILEVDYLVSGAVIEARLSAQGNYVNNGIEFSKKGRPVAYYLYNTHPGSSTLHNPMEYARYPASEVLHIFRETRPGQNRGASGMSTVLHRLRDLDDYEHAQIVRQKIAACFAIFVHGDPSARPGVDSTDGGYKGERIEPGQIERLGPGETVTFGSPPETRDYDAYTRRVLQGIAAGIGITYESLTNDYSNVNFSSGRMGWIEMSRMVEEYQDEIVILQLCDSVWDWFLEGLAVDGKINPNARFDISWTPPGRQMLDPVKEMKGILEQMRAGLLSWQDAVRKMGLDPDVLFAQIKADRERFDRDDIMTTADPKHDKPEPAAPAESEKPKPKPEEK